MLGGAPCRLFREQQVCSLHESAPKLGDLFGGADAFTSMTTHLCSKNSLVDP